MTADTPESRLLRAIAGEPQPCGHIERFVEHIAAHPEVVISTGEDEDMAPTVECQLCEVGIPWRMFLKLVVGELQERN
jgi:hypothetical protein